MILPPVIVTNFKRRITGVTTTANNVTAAQKGLADYEIGLCGPSQEWKLWQILLFGFKRPEGRQFRIWHVRRNSEMAWGLFAKYILRQPLKLVFTSASIRRHSSYPRWLISKMDAVIATSEKAASLVPNVALIQPHGVDVDLFKPGQKTPSPTLVYTSRIRHQKGTHIFVEALCAVLPDFPDVSAYFIGMALGKDRSYLQALKDKIQKAGIDNQVTWHGELAPEKVSDILGRAHIAVATPLREEFGVTPFEGLASGCGVLVSDTGAFSLAVSGGETGIIVAVDDVPATINALRSLLQDRGKRQNMMMSARALATEKFSIENEATAILGVYDRVSH